MRAVLILLCLAGLAAVALAAALGSPGLPYLRGAAEVQALASERVRAAVGDAAGVAVMASGRDVLLTGRVGTVEERNRVAAAAASVPLVRSVFNQVEVLPAGDPFRLLVERSPGGLVLSGSVPGPEAAATLLSEAREVAAGALDGGLAPTGSVAPGWEAMARAGLRALSRLAEGRLEMEDGAARLSGRAPNKAAEAAARAAVVDAPGTWTVELRRAAPAFTAMKMPDGAIIVGGGAPDASVRDRLLETATALSLQPVGGTVELGDGDSPAGWEALVSRGLAALGQAEEGLMTVTGMQGTLSATVAGEAGRAAILARLGDRWQAEITVASQAEPRSEGVPAAALPDAPADQAISADPATPAGSATSADPATPAGSATSADPAAPAADTLSGTPVGTLPETPAVADGGSPSITLAYGGEGQFTASGTLPQDIAPSALAAMLPGIDVRALAVGEGPAGPGWRQAVEALSIALPRFLRARVTLSDGRLAVEGTLARGFSAAGMRATLTAALERGWELALDLVETDPLAELIVTRAGGAPPVLSGLVPAALGPDEALVLLGEGATGDGLAGGGAGQPAAWAEAIAATGVAVALFESARGRITEGEIELSGVLRPGYAADAVTERLTAAAPGGWRVAIDAAETAAGEGDRRVSLESGSVEVYRNGFWLPALDFPVSAERCKQEADAALAGEQVRFVTGSAEIDAAGLALIDRLAAIATRCLNSSAMQLEIAGHTDSVGNDGRNTTLSEQRAGAVRAALVERGVRADALSAVGHGESQPVATNDTPEGRAQNRRIAFNWSER